MQQSGYANLVKLRGDQQQAVLGTRFYSENLQDRRINSRPIVFGSLLVVLLSREDPRVKSRTSTSANGKR